MKTKIIYALIIALVGIAIRLVTFLLGFETDKIGTTAATIYGVVIGIVSLVVLFVLVWLGVRAVRDEMPDQCLTYGQGVGAGVIIVLIAAVIGAIYTGVHVSLINPDLAENTIAFTRQKYAEAGMGDEQIEMAGKILRIMAHPGVVMVMAFISKMFWGTIVSLIAAAIVKRAPQSQPASQIPPPL